MWVKMAKPVGGLHHFIGYATFISGLGTQPLPEKSLWENFDGHLTYTYLLLSSLAGVSKSRP